MNQKLFELIENMTGYFLTKEELNEIVQAVKEMDVPDGWFCPIPPKNIPDNFEWVAMDESGEWFAYEKKPAKKIASFYGSFGQWGRIAINTTPDLNWEETLKEIPR